MNIQIGTSREATKAKQQDKKLRGMAEWEWERESDTKDIRFHEREGIVKKFVCEREEASSEFFWK